jgi:hypothetical protein
MTVRDMLTALQRLPRDAEVLAMEAGCEQYCEIELDDVELRATGSICISGSGEIPRHTAKAVDGPSTRSNQSIYSAAMGRATERPNLSPQRYRSVRTGLSPPYRLARTV